MLRSWRIFFSRGIPKRNFDSHHQFHSFFRSSDHRSFNENNHLTPTTLFSIAQQRWRTTIIRRTEVAKVFAGKNVFDIGHMLQQLKENVKKREFEQFQMNMYTFGRSKAVLAPEENQQLISTLKVWNQEDHSDQEVANILKSLANLKFSESKQEQRDILDAIIGRFLEKNQQSFRWFALFLTGLRSLKYSSNLLTEKQRQRIVGLLGELKEDCDERSYPELLSGIFGLEIRWDEINEAGKENLLNQLEVLKSEITAESIADVLFNFGKMKVNLKESPYKNTILELTMKALKETEKDNGQGKLDLPRVVSMMIKIPFLH
jgi:hypothetical protein